MLYRQMPKNGDRLSILGFGCMRLPERRGKIVDDRATRQIRDAIDRGVNYLDTALPYHMGACEPFLARALADGYRERVRLATKLPPWSVKRRDDMDAILASQLERLGTDRIDYYPVHALKAASWKKMKALGVREFLDAAVADGRIGAAGFSFHGDTETFRQILDEYDWTSALVQYNYLDEHNQAGIEGIRYAAGKGVGVIVMEPLRGGKLANVVPDEVAAIWNEAGVKRSPAEWALRWVWNHPEVILVLSGMNDEAHVDQNVRIAGEAEPNSLAEAELALVGRAADAYRRRMKAGCTGCRYCMPCPHGVDIPGCLEALDTLSLTGDRSVQRINYIMRVGGIMNDDEPAYASYCQECGKCLAACPQQIPIPERLKETARQLEGPMTTFLKWGTKAFLAMQRRGANRSARRRRRRG